MLTVGAFVDQEPFFYGQNFPGRAEPFHPLLEPFLAEFYKAQPQRWDPVLNRPVNLPDLGIPGSHSEVSVFSQALYAAEAALNRQLTPADLPGLADRFALYNIGTNAGNSRSPGNLWEAIPRCPACRYLTPGVTAFPK